MNVAGGSPTAAGIGSITFTSMGGPVGVVGIGAVAGVLGIGVVPGVVAGVLGIGVVPGEVGVWLGTVGIPVGAGVVAMPGSSSAHAQLRSVATMTDAMLTAPIEVSNFFIQSPMFGEMPPA